MRRRQTFHTHQRSSLLPIVSSTPTHFEVTEVIKPASNLSVPRIISQHHSSSNFGSTKYLHPPAISDISEDKCYLTVNNASNDSNQKRPPIKSSSGDGNTHLMPKCSSYLLRNTEYLAKHRKSNDSQTSDPSLNCRLPNMPAANAYGNNLAKSKLEIGVKEEKLPLERDLDVQSVINERRPSKLKCNNVNGRGRRGGGGGGFASQTNSFNHIYARDENEDKSISNADNDIRIYVDDTDSQGSEKEKLTNDQEESRVCRERSLGTLSNISLIKQSETDVTSNSTAEDVRNPQTNDESP